jgi:hypothetical protein
MTKKKVADLFVEVLAEAGVQRIYGVSAIRSMESRRDQSTIQLDGTRAREIL